MCVCVYERDRVKETDRKRRNKEIEKTDSQAEKERRKTEREN